MNNKKWIIGGITVIFILLIIGSAIYFLNKEDSTTESSISSDQESTDFDLLPYSRFEIDYELEDEEFGTMTTVSIVGNTRFIETNALPNHDTGDFPNSNNPNTISAQNSSYEITISPIYTGAAIFAREPGVAVNGVKFEPQTAESVSCASGENYSVEAVQDFLDLGLDFNNAHVQPTGTYHYHAVSDDLVDFAEEENDIVHVGFALDGHLMYYSVSGSYKSSFKLGTDLRTGTDCSINLGPISLTPELQDSTPDGTYVSDWVYNDSAGDLDQCNGIEIDGEYLYFITDEYPYIPRCLNGEFEESAPGRR